MNGCSFLVFFLIFTLVFPAVPTAGFWSIIQKLKWYKYCWITKDPGLCNPKTNGALQSFAGEENNLVEEEPLALVTTTPCSTTTTEETTTTTITTEMTTLIPIQLVPIIEEPKPIQNLQVSETGGGSCPKKTDLSFSHIFNFHGRSNDQKDPMKIERTISDLCLLSAFRCKSDNHCGLGRKCCSVNSRYHESCKLCIFVP